MHMLMNMHRPCEEHGKAQKPAFRAQLEPLPPPHPPTVGAEWLIAVL